jgi:large subunit ribosomal protein L18
MSNSNKRVKTLVRSKLKKQNKRHVVVINRTGQHIYAQLKTPGPLGQVIGSMSTLTPSIVKELKGKSSSNKDAAYVVGKAFGEYVKQKGIDKLVVDRGGRLFWGRVKALVKGVADTGVIV